MLSRPPINNDPRQWAKWYDELWRMLGTSVGISWGSILKSGSKLTDIETRPHSDLQNVLQADPTSSSTAGGKHVTDAQLKVYKDHTSNTGNPHEVTSAQVGAEPVLGNPSVSGYVLSSTSTGSRSWIAPVSTYKAGITTRDINAATANVTVAHGLGRVPRMVRVHATLVQTSATTECHGVYDGTDNSGLATIQSEGTTTAVDDNSYSSTSFVLGFAATPGSDNPYTGSNRQTASITVDATNITFVWTKTGTVSSATANILWEAM